MDPTACLDRALNALDDEDFDQADSALSDLATWTLRGGFSPVLSKSMTLALIRHLNAANEAREETKGA